MNIEESKPPQELEGPEFSPEFLNLYYEYLFPYDSMFKWLSYGNYKESPHEINGVDSEYFPHREWSFTIDDIYIRYQSFKDKNDMISAIKKHQPHKIDIGAVFTGCPKDHKTIQPELFKPLERELVFDIDMTDYDDIRTCCKGAEICKKCWPYMTMAIRVVNRALKEDFSFKHMLWVFSGRRGVHCWVCDPEARQLPNDARAAIVDYLSVSTGSSENSDKKLKNTFTSIHPMIHKAYDILDTYFEKYIADESGQGLLSKDNFVKILNKLPNENIREELYDLWNKNPKITGAEKWRQIKVKTSADDNHQNLSSKKKRINYPELEAWRYELVFTHCYPRLDANVSKTQNHLLKSPFCVHPKTGKVCIPIDPNNPDAFDPFNVPTLKTLCHEINSLPREFLQTEGIDGIIEKTEMKKPIYYFKTEFLKDLNISNQKQIRDRFDQISASKMDF